MIARHGAEARKQAIPFGPFLALGGVIGALVRRRDRRLVPGRVLPRRREPRTPAGSRQALADAPICEHERSPAHDLHGQIVLEQQADKSIVGLDIEAGSIAATEVRVERQRPR